MKIKSIYLVNDDLDRCYAEFLAFLKSKYPILNNGGGDAPTAELTPKSESDQTVLTMESSVPGQGGTLNPQEAWWCTML